MITAKQLAANISNAQRSTGPRTDAGKKRSCLNATRHGLTGQVVVLPEEDMAAFNKFAAGLVASLDPDGAHETQLAQLYASIQWRLNRANAIEDNLFTLGVMEEIAENLNLEHPEAHNATSYAKTFRDQSEVFNRISIYTQRLVNSAAKVLRQLQEMQAGRRHHKHSQLYEAIRAYKLARMTNQPFDPKENGFDLTMNQIQAEMQRLHRDNLARNAETEHRIPTKSKKSAA